jgi:hypothetical protein
MLKKLPKGLLEFQQMFPDEKACRGYLWHVRWPNGFVCPHCGGVSAREEANRPLLWGLPELREADLADLWDGDAWD